MKTCICCTRTLPIERFPERNRRGVVTRLSRCDQCQKGYDAVRYRDRNRKPEHGERPVYYRPAVEKVCDAAMDAWRFAVNREQPMRWAA